MQREGRSRAFRGARESERAPRGRTARSARSQAPRGGAGPPREREGSVRALPRSGRAAGAPRIRPTRQEEARPHPPRLPLLEYRHRCVNRCGQACGSRGVLATSSPSVRGTPRRSDSTPAGAPMREPASPTWREETRGSSWNRVPRERGPVHPDHPAVEGRAANVAQGTEDLNGMPGAPATVGPEHALRRLFRDGPAPDANRSGVPTSQGPPLGYPRQGFGGPNLAPDIPWTVRRTSDSTTRS